MGTNFYIRRTEPRLVYDEYHVAKTSAGWLPSFEAHSSYEGDDRPSVHSVADIKALVDSGAYTIVDEYGDGYDWDGFAERVLEFGDEFNCRSHTNAYVDPQGFEFLEYEYI